MCGILGILKKSNNFKISTSELSKSTRHLLNRGPDNLTTFQDSCILLAHSRLSIIDLNERSNQPLRSNCGRYIIAYNGEIYNYKELREDLIENGIVFKTDSDTEVLLEGYIKFQDKFLKKLRGCFSFVIYDSLEHLIVLSRDTFGMKPLFIAEDSYGFYFSSSINAISELLSNLSIRKSSVRDFKLFGFIPEPCTFYNEIQSFQPGYVMTIHQGGKARISNAFLTIEEIYLESLNKETKINPDNDKYLQAVSKVIQRHSIADVDVTLGLSSGFDSSFIAFCMNKEDITTSTLEFENRKRDNESKESLNISKYLNITHNPILITEDDSKKALKEFSTIKSKPTIDGFNIYLLSRFIKRKGGKVLITGVGGDEILGSYPSFKMIPILWRMRAIIRLFIPLLSYLDKKLFSYSKRNKTFAKLLCINLENKISLYLWFRSISDFYLAGNINEIKKINREVFNSISKRIVTPLKLEKSWMLLISFYESSFYLRSQLLHDSDLYSMENSVELRSPYVDVEMYQETLPLLKRYGPLKNYLSTIFFTSEFRQLLALKKKKSFTTNIYEISAKNNTKNSFETNINHFMDEVLKRYGK